MSSTLHKGRLRKVGLLAATATLSWIGFAATGATAYASTTDTGRGQGSSAPAHDNGHGKDDSKANGTGSTTTSSTDTGSSDHSSGNSGTTGDSTQPQPLSNADQNAGGANGQCPGGPYCSTRDGSPSGNGNGNGKATGKPCAGCVGKADNKNPQGQNPNGSDHNAGYECDRNHGIGRSNPAHTGCTSGSTPPPSCSGDECDGGDGESVPPNCTGAGCDGDDSDNAGDNDGDNAGSTPPTECTGGAMINGACVSGATLHRDPGTTPAQVQGLALTRDMAASSLPFTGSPVDKLLAWGLSALAIGSALVAVTRRRRTA